MKISYNWLKWYVPGIPEADKLADVFAYHLCEVEGTEKIGDDTVYDLNILPNRAHDLLCHHGVARELSGQLGIEFKDPTPMYKVPESQPTKLQIEIQTPNCRRYMGRIVRGVKIGPSPEWIVKHLEAIGQRSINNIVDATNLCMFDCGQPMHAFDLKKLFSEKIIVRAARENEKMTTLDDKHVDLKLADMVITDDEEVLALAGVKGGTKAEVDEHTTEIVLEVANFEPTTVRKTAKRIGIFTDSAKRFENDLSPELGSFAMRELSALIKEMCPGATFEDIVDVYPVVDFSEAQIARGEATSEKLTNRVYPNPQKKRELSFTVSEINKKLGAKISAGEVEDILTRYAYEFTKEGERIALSVPPLRLDLAGAHDMAEEIGRIYGYEKIQPEIPKIDPVSQHGAGFIPKINETYARVCAAREKLLADGYSEVMTYTFCKKGKVEVARGAKGKEFLRTNLSDALKESYELNRLNAPLLGEEEIKIFEIGTVFPQVGPVGGEEIHVAYSDKKGVIESTLEEFAKDLTWIPDQVRKDTTGDKKFVAWSQYPFITRDVAVWVSKETSPNELVALCQKHGTKLLARDPQLFDQFTKGDKTSLAVRMVFQSHERTLIDAEITEIMVKITHEIEAKGWEVR